MSILGIYWVPRHNRTDDHQYITDIQPPAIRLLDPDASQMAFAYKLAPDALFLPRDWALSEQHDDLKNNPVATGKRHAQEWRAKINSWRQTGFHLPPDDKIIVVGINEPRVWECLHQVVDYTVAFLDECKWLGLRACALNLAVGWPANTGPNTPPDWTPYAPVMDAIKRGRHFLCVHEYWYKIGPQDGAGWYAHRIRHNTWNVPIIIGECGVDNYVDLARWQKEGGPRGWWGNISPAQYAEQLVQYARGLDNRVVAMLPFLTDYADRQWQSFDTLDVRHEIVRRVEEMIPTAPVNQSTYVPIINQGPNVNLFDRSLAFVLRWEGGWSDNPADPGGATNKGITYNTFKAWRKSGGQPEPTLDDLRNISDEEVRQIYYQWYWLASGAYEMKWPLCLAHFDTAVNAGVGRADRMYADSGDNFEVYMGNLIRWYASISGFETFGRGWMNRRGDLLLEANR